MNVQELLYKSKHSKEFLLLLEEKNPEIAIRTITHSNPLLVFWISPFGKIYDAKNAHHDNPPDGDNTVLSSPINNGYLRGRIAMFGNIPYVVIYGDNNKQLSKRQFLLLRKSYQNLFNFVLEKKKLDISNARFINELGEDI